MSNKAFSTIWTIVLISLFPLVFKETLPPSNELLFVKDFPTFHLSHGRKAIVSGDVINACHFNYIVVCMSLTECTFNAHVNQ